MATNYRKVTEFKTVEDFENYLKSENIQIGLAHNIPSDLMFSSKSFISITFR